MKLLIKLLLILLLSSSSARANYAVFDWMETSLLSLSNLFASCIEVPNYQGFSNSNVLLNTNKSGQWISTGVYVQSGKSVSINWQSNGLQTLPRKYLVIYRIDPRFNVPQLLVERYNHTSQKYILDATDFLTSAANFSIPGTGATANFFEQYEPSVIFVNSGDIINISLVDQATFFGKDALGAELNPGNINPYALTTSSSGLNNQIVYTNVAAWCNAIDPNYRSVCYNNAYNIILNNVIDGDLNEPLFQNISNSVSSCSSNASAPSSSLCYYDQGRGMNISIGSDIIKDDTKNFIYSTALKKYFLYYQAQSSGTLKIGSSWPIQNMITNAPNGQLMHEWPTNKPIITGVTVQPQFLFFGRYFLEIEVGSSNSLNSDNVNDLDIEYLIVSDNSLPPNTQSGTSITNGAKFDASSTGYLMMRINNTASTVQGNINVNIVNYVGTTWLSDILYKDILLPLKAEFNNTTITFYTALASGPTFKFIVKSALSLYIVLSGLLFLAGITQITKYDLFARVAKISLIAVLISNNSWNFFNQYLFNVFLNSADYLMLSASGSTSSFNNVFGFIDPIFDKLTNPIVWSLLFIQLLQIQNGLAFFAIMTIYGMTRYAKAIISVVIGYVLAFVGLCLMISLAPFFIILILFERTRSIFNNWLSVLLGYVIQPTILLIFFLLIDQIIGAQLNKVIIRACWDWLIPIEIGLDLKHVGIPLSFSFPLPFLPGIPFFVTKISSITEPNQLYNYANTYIGVASSSLLFYCYCAMSAGLVNYVTSISEALTNTRTPTKENNENTPPSAQTSVLRNFDSAQGKAKNFSRGLFSDVKSLSSKVVDATRANLRNSNTPKNDQSSKAENETAKTSDLVLSKKDKP